LVTNAVDAAGIGRSRTATLSAWKLFDELRDIAPILSFDTLVHHTGLQAMQCAVSTDVAFGYGDAIASTIQLRS
jgi:hypothetical protein